MPMTAIIFTLCPVGDNIKKKKKSLGDGAAWSGGAARPATLNARGHNPAYRLHTDNNGETKAEQQSINLLHITFQASQGGVCTAG